MMLYDSIKFIIKIFFATNCPATNFPVTDDGMFHWHFRAPRMQKFWFSEVNARNFLLPPVTVHQFTMHSQCLGSWFWWVKLIWESFNHHYSRMGKERNAKGCNQTGCQPLKTLDPPEQRSGHFGPLWPCRSSSWLLTSVQGPWWALLHWQGFQHSQNNVP